MLMWLCVKVYLFYFRIASVPFGSGCGRQSAFSFHFTPFQLSKWNDIIIIFFGVLGLWSSSSCNFALQICNFPSHGSDVTTVITRRSLAARWWWSLLLLPQIKIHQKFIYCLYRRCLWPYNNISLSFNQNNVLSFSQQPLWFDRTQKWNENKIDWNGLEMIMCLWFAVAHLCQVPTNNQQNTKYIHMKLCHRRDAI